MQFWKSLDPIQIILADSDPDKHFNLAQARNNAARKAKSDVLVFADCDTIPESDTQITTAIKLAQQQADVVYPFEEYVYLPHDAVGARYDDLAEVTPIRTRVHSVGGIIVARVDSFLELGGFDECFTQWGFEDTAFMMAARTLGTVMRVPGKVYHLGHEVPEGRDYSEKNPGYWRNELYRFADGKPELMRALIG
jgi:predicted glycosyltransferase involved in capsule biosynthesis